MATIRGKKDTDSMRDALVPSESEDEQYGPYRYPKASHSDSPSNVNSYPVILDHGLDLSMAISDITDVADEGIIVDALCCKLHPLTVNILLSVLTCLSGMVMGISMPIYIQAVHNAGSDIYTILVVPSIWFPVVFFLINVTIVIFFDRSVSLWPTASWKAIFTVASLHTLRSEFPLFITQLSIFNQSIDLH